MGRRLTTLGLAAMAACIAGSSLALDPPAAPRQQPPGLHCVAPKVAREVKTKSGKLVWKCIKLKID
ncbi:MAG: hypothetical protein ACHP84_00160 [Caulobacterales bacterium]